MHADGDCHAVEGVLSKDMATPGEYLQTEQKGRVSLLYLTFSSHLASFLLRWKAADTVFVMLSFSFRAQIPRSNFGQVAHVQPTPWVTLRSWHPRRAPEATCWLRLGCWSNNSANSHSSLGALNRRVLRSCLVPPCSYPPHRHRHQRRLANCDWMPASYTSGQLSNPHRHPTCWASSQRSTLSLARRAMEPGHLLHSVLTRPSGAAARRLEMRHPFVPTTQQIISFSDNIIIRAAQLADQQWNAEWADNSTRLRTSIPDTGTHTPGMTLPRRAWVRLNRLAPVLDVSAPACANEVWPPLRPVSVA